MQAIVTKYVGPTNVKGARIIAKAAAGKVCISYPYESTLAKSHQIAAIALAKKLGWSGGWIAGGMPSGDGYVFVCADRDDARFVIAGE